MAIATQQTYTAPREILPYVQLFTIVLFVASRAWQVVTNFRQRNTGELALLTLMMNAAGSAARIFTSSQEVKQVGDRGRPFVCVCVCVCARAREAQMRDAPILIPSCSLIHIARTSRSPLCSGRCSPPSSSPRH